MGTNPSSISSSSSIPKFDIVQAGNTSGNQQTYYIRTSGMYLYLNSVSGGSNDLTVQSTGSPNNDMRWIISLVSGYSYNSYNIQGGVAYPAVTLSNLCSSCSFTIETF